ncbi:MAG: glycosyltransferase family 2 protein [Planctomycetes bacterium]|nr:glycosyltransferase family 2 protein [Planctomycetota bacterium]MCW8137042.1 glycosyltransferase family 2 protein [Planctomycetota bacterium]
MPAVSVVIPVFNEADNVGPLAEEVRAALAGQDFELIFVDDGSIDGTAARCEALGWVRVLRHERNRGQSAATITGLHAAKGDIIVTLDGDGQNDPAAIPALLEALKSHDAAQGIRSRRNDSLWRRLGSRVAWLVRNLVVRDGIKDIGCSLRAFPREAALMLPQFNGLHRLMPAIFVFMGMKVAQVPTNHRPRTAGVSKYGNLKRGARGLVDLMGLYWLKRRVYRYESGKKPAGP